MFRTWSRYAWIAFHYGPKMIGLHPIMVPGCLDYIPLWSRDAWITFHYGPEMLGLQFHWRRNPITRTTVDWFHKTSATPLIDSIVIFEHHCLLRPHLRQSHVLFKIRTAKSFTLWSVHSITITIVQILCLYWCFCSNNSCRYIVLQLNMC